ncbi:tyrosine-type recombinase/integrase [Sedimentitalea nanhaiensis]|uniref:Phage integrase family protein n=1 Tax=Sedimentitalea nanhaiensis TaxID=999627 RepID=A0A1I7BVN4_9RHOB|nr:tyrosine-type recombinase/integrase [Sedimentitalea nanhaiensis]SFT91161.1 Phage integrase family protein [Sedimentitalea nanhaiensis]
MKLSFRQPKLYKSNRAELIWSPEEVQALLDAARPKEARVIIAASEGGLSPQDIGILKLRHVQATPRGRRLFLRRTKTGNPISLPVTPALGALIDTVPSGQEWIVTSRTGKRLTSLRASQIIREVKLRHNARARLDADMMPIRDELHPYDLRGTAATALLRAGCSLKEIAVTMGWGLRHAGPVIERYVALVPEVLVKLMAVRSRQDP